MLKQEVPSQLKELLDRQQLNGVPVLLSTTSDLSVAGEVREEWVIANRDHLAVVRDGPEPQVEFHVPIPRVEKFRARSSVGSGFLQAYVDDAWVDVARYSNRLATRFHKLAEKLESLRENGNVDVQPEEQIDADHCPKCGLRLPAETAACTRCLPRKAIIARLWQFVRPQWRGALGICLLMLLSVALELVPPKLQQILVDDILMGGAAAPVASSLLMALASVVAALVVTRLILAVVNWNKRLLANKVGVGLTFDLRSQLVKKLHNQGIGYFDRHETGALTSRVVQDSEVLHSLVQQITGGFLLQIVQVVAIGVMLFTLNPKLALFTLIPAPLVFFGSVFFWRRVYPNYYRYWESNSRQAGSVSGMISGMRVVKAFAQEPREFDRFRRASENVRTSRVTVDRATASYSTLFSLVFSMGGLIVWYVGGREVLSTRDGQGGMTLGELMAFLAYLGMFYEPLSTLSEFTTWATSVMTGCQRVFELLDSPAETIESNTPQPLGQVNGKIEFENVTFGYEPNRPVLKELDFTIQPGERIGIVGRSGSGKSTLVNLISRFYDPAEGRVQVDGIDVRNVASVELRRNVGVVLQEPFLFRGTIADNLIYGQPTADAQQAIAAARASQAHDFVLKKPLAYDTWLGERGAGLSGGEKQRLSIARALLYDPKVLILDEATSSIDTESEKDIQEALRIASRGRTTIAIAHRLSTLRDCDRIFVLDQGRLMEQGTHQELMKLNGSYARMVHIQTQVSRNMRVDSAIGAELEQIDNATTLRTNDETANPSELAPQWLQPGNATLRKGAHDTLEIVLPDGAIVRGSSAVCCFPASRPDEFISLRTCDREGDDHEVGILRHLEDWPRDIQELIRRARSRSYFLRELIGIETVALENGHLHFRARTQAGPAQFTMRWNQNQAQDFGEQGKILVDLDDNHYVVPDVSTLPDRDRELLGRFIY